MNNSTILLIDDDQDDREFFQIALDTAQPGTDCMTAESGSTAIELLNKHAGPGFIFLDLNMPLMSGKECLSHIRKLEKYSETPVIIFTTSSYDQDIEQCKNLGATHFLTKTHDLDHLSSLISRIISGRVTSFIVA